jgi:hypothetical protein
VLPDSHATTGATSSVVSDESSVAIVSIFCVRERVAAAASDAAATAAKPVRR